MIKVTDNKYLLGMMRQFKAPNHLVVAAVHAAHMIGCEFIFFQPDKINFEN